MEKIYYDRDANLKYLKDKTIGVIGYGIQGRAQALNLRDSGLKVMIANRRDEYTRQAKKDGFRIHDIIELAARSDIILLLIPDQAHAKVYDRFIHNNIRAGSMLSVAHGYSLRFKTFKVKPGIDICMLAPRMPGKQIREFYLAGGGVPAFVDVVRDSSGLALKRILAVSKAAGFTKAGVLRVDYRVETDLDLITEQFLVAGIVKLIHSGFDVLTKDFGYPAVPTLMELYASGELSEVLKMASKLGIGRVFQKNASPTCQFGIASTFDRILGPKIEKTAKSIIKEIKNGSFSKRLDKEGDAGYPQVKKLWRRVDERGLVRAQDWINRNFKVKEE